MRYPSDELTDAERARLAPHFTDLDGPVFALVNLPETVKGALFARYSRYPGTLRRLFLDEFADSLPETTHGLRRRGGQARGRALRAHLRRLRRRLRRPARRRPRRLRVDEQHPHQDPPAPAARRLPRAVDALHRLRRADARRRLPLLPRRARSAPSTSGDGLPVRLLRGGAADRARVGRRDATRAPRASPTPRVAARSTPRPTTCCAGCCPPASLSHMGIYATGQAYEQLILHLLGHPLPEARHYGGADPRRDQGRDAELRRARRAPRARRRVGRATSSAAARPASAGPRGSASTATSAEDDRPSVRLLHVDGDEDLLLAALLFEAAGVSEERTRAEVARLSADERARLLADLSASAPTAATARAAASRRCATASRSSPTTARSATSSATAC